MEKKIKQLFAILIFFVLCCGTAFQAAAQVNQYGTPLITNYTPEQYDASPANYDAVQSQQGIMYFANYGYVLEYDGVSWKKIEVVPNLPVLSLSIDSLGIIYVNAGNQFGYIAPDSLGRMSYFSLSALLDSTDRHVENVGKTFVTKDGVYFQTSETLYLYSFDLVHGIVKNHGHSTDKQPVVLPAETEFTDSYMIEDEKVFVHQKDLGLMQLVDDDFIPLTKGIKFIKRRTMAILPFKRHQIIICTEKAGLFYYTYQRGFGYFRSESNDYTDQVYSLAATTLPDAYVLATINMGTIVIDKEPTRGLRRMRVRYTRQAGLPSEQITSIYNNQEFDRNLIWLTSHYGISRSRLNAALKRMNEASVVKDVILDIMRHDNDLYVRSLGEVYWMRDTLDEFHFERIKDITSNSSWLQFDVSEIVEKEVGRRTVERRERNDKILVGTRFGLYEINEKMASEIDFDFKRWREDRIIKSGDPNDDYFIQNMAQSVSNPDRLFLALNDGVAIVSNQKYRWLDEGRIADIEEKSITDVAEDSTGNLWLVVKDNGLIRLQPKDTAITIKGAIKRRDSIAFDVFPPIEAQFHYGQDQGLPKMEERGILYLDGKMLFSTINGLYSYNPATDAFEKNETFAGTLSDGTRILGLKQDESGNCWLRIHNQDGTGIAYFKKQEDGSYVHETDELHHLPRMTVESIFPDNDSTVWFSGTDGLFTYNLNYQPDSAQKFLTLIRKVTIENDSVIYWGSGYSNGLNVSYSQKDDWRPALEYSHNHIQFQYASPFFEKEEAIEYSYKLVPYETSWSGWTQETKKDYMNLEKGKYTFQVRARNIYGHISEPATFEFTILTPWYDTWWFHAIEIMSFLLLLGISIWFNRTGRAKKVTPIITMVTVTAIFKMIAGLIIGPLVNVFSEGIVYFKIVLNTLFGALLFPTWSIFMRLIQKGTFKDEADIIPDTEIESSGSDAETD